MTQRPRSPSGHDGVGRRDAWDRQRSLTQVTLGWASASVVLGTVLLLRTRSRWWRAFGQQHLGWGLVDLGVVAVVEGVQRARRRRMPDPYGAETLTREQRRLHRVLAVNAVADAGYCLLGAALWRSRPRDSRAAGAGAAIVVQGAFLLGHDSFHAVGTRNVEDVVTA